MRKGDNDYKKKEMIKNKDEKDKNKVQIMLMNQMSDNEIEMVVEVKGTNN